jgi:hypothetical protein
MYPKNAAVPPEVDLGQVLLIADGTIQTTGVSVRVKIGTGAWGAGAGSASCDATSGIWTYAPSQAETNADYFIVALYKASCTALSKTIVTTVSSVAGYAGLDWSLVRAPTTTLNLSGTTISTSQAVATVTNLTNLPSIPANWLTAAGIAAGALDNKGNWNVGKTGYALAYDIAGAFSTVNGTLATLATAANLATVAGYLDTEIASILAVTNKLDTTMVLDGAVYQFTANALELGPAGGGGGSSDWNADERTAIRTILGIPAAGTTPEVPSAGALKVIDDLLDTEIAALTTAVDNLPTNAELTAALGTGTWATALPWNAAWDAEVQSECADAFNAYDAPTKAEMDTAFTEIKGATWSSSTDTLEAIRDRGDAAWVTGSGGSGGGSSTGNGTGSTAALRGTTDLTPIQFTFPTASLNNAAFTTKTKRIDGGSSANITGAISFLYSINGQHYYQIAYNAADRPSAAGVVTYLLSDGTSTVSFDLQVIAIASDGSGIAVLPGRDRAVADAGASTITVKLGEIITIARGVVDANGQPMDLSGFTNLQFVVQDARGVDLATVNHADITISGVDDDTYSFVTPSAITAKLGVFDFSLNQVGGAQIVGGKWIVLRRAVAD